MGQLAQDVRRRSVPLSEGSSDLTHPSLSASRTAHLHWAEKWGTDVNEPVPKAIKKCSDSWLKRPDYHGSYYRFAWRRSLPSLSHNNGLEGTNGMIKSAYTMRIALGFSRTLVLMEQLVEDKSKDPVRQVSLLSMQGSIYTTRDLGASQEADDPHERCQHVAQVDGEAESGKPALRHLRAQRQPHLADPVEQLCGWSRPQGDVGRTPRGGRVDQPELRLLQLVSGSGG
jgi:hypothetical protein